MTLEETKDLMCSPNYKERFKAEYYQLKIRYEKLKAMCEKWEKGAEHDILEIPAGSPVHLQHCPRSSI